MKRNILLLLLLLAGQLTVFSMGVDADSLTGFAPYTVTGAVKDAKGSPIAGATVRIENDWSYYDVRTDATGHYISPKLPHASYKVVAWYTTTYKGEKYILRLGMPDDADYAYVDVTKGAVRNFVQKISGVIPDQDQDGNGRGYFGLTVSFHNGTGSIYDEGRLQTGDYIAVMLTPTGPLIDGSTGKTVERAFEIKAGNDGHPVIDIPIGAYEVRAFVDRGGSWKQLLIGTFSSQTDRILINPKSSDYGKGSYQNGLSMIGLYIREPR